MPKMMLRIIVLAHICACTDASLRSGKMFATKGVVPLLVQYINDSDIKNNLSLTDVENTVSIALSSIHNIAKISELKPLFEEAGAVGALKFYFSYVDEKIQMSALCGVACLLSESDTSDLLDDYGN